jgi:hypothetical protein
MSRATTPDDDADELAEPLRRPMVISVRAGRRSIDLPMKAARPQKE